MSWSDRVARLRIVVVDDFFFFCQTHVINLFLDNIFVFPFRSQQFVSAHDLKKRCAINWNESQRKKDNPFQLTPSCGIYLIAYRYNLYRHSVLGIGRCPFPASICHVFVFFFSFYFVVAFQIFIQFDPYNGSASTLYENEYDFTGHKTTVLRYLVS